MPFLKCRNGEGSNRCLEMPFLWQRDNEVINCGTVFDKTICSAFASKSKQLPLLVYCVSYFEIEATKLWKRVTVLLRASRAKGCKFPTPCSKREKMDLEANVQKGWNASVTESEVRVREFGKSAEQAEVSDLALM